MGRVGGSCAIAAMLAAGALFPASAAPPERLEPCLACHGTEGQSETPEVPSLGAQRSPYTLIQLFMFREGLRVAEPMTALAKEFSDQDLQSTADFIATLPPPQKGKPKLSWPGWVSRLSLSCGKSSDSQSRWFSVK